MSNHSLNLRPEEPDLGPWRPAEVSELLSRVPGLGTSPADPSGRTRPAVVAVDGRGAAGKSTLGALLAERVPGAVVVHTDDIAWHEPFFAWGHLLRDLLEQVHTGQAVDFTPPMWPVKGRSGSITVPAECPLVVVEGCAAGQRIVADLLDLLVWVQGDFAEQERRGIERDTADGTNGSREETVAFWHEWMGHELPFFAEDRPWERADVVVAATPVIELAPGQLALGRPLTSGKGGPEAG